MTDTRSAPRAAAGANRSEIANGWPLILTAAVGFLTLPTTLPVYSLGVLTAPLQHEFGWSRGDIQAAVLFSTGLGVVCAPIVGYLLSVVGVRRLAVTGLLGMALGFACAARTPGALWQFYLAYSIMSICGAGAGAITWSRLIAGAFVRQRGLALGLALAGTGFSAIVGPLLTANLLRNFGWRGAYVGLAMVPLLLALPLALTFIPASERAHQARPRTESLGTTLSGFTVGDALRSYRFWALASSITIVYFALSGLIPHLAPLLTDRGMPIESAAKITSILGPSIIVSRMVLGWLFDRFWAPALGVLTLLPAAGACLLLKLDLGFYQYLGAVALLGVATGVEIDILSYVTARYFGMYRYARIYGWIFSAYSVSAGLAPTAFGHLYDASHDYRTALDLAAVLFIVGCALLLTLGRYPELPQRAD